MQITKFIVCILFILMTNCCKQKPSSNFKQLNNYIDNYKPKIIKSQNFGDTILLNVEQRGTVIIKHYVDIRKIKKDNFDNSFDTECSYETHKVDSTIYVESKKIKLKALMTEHYRTSFSGGDNVYGITEKGDTIFLYHLLGYIN